MSRIGSEFQSFEHGWWLACRRSCRSDQLETIQRHTFYNELHEAPEEHLGFQTIAPLNTMANRMDMRQNMPLTFDTNEMEVVIQVMLSRYASDRSTGIVMDSRRRGAPRGHLRGRHSAAGHPVLDLADRDLTEYMMEVSTERSLLGMTIIGKEACGTHDTTSQFVLMIDEGICKDLCANAVRFGSTAMFGEHRRAHVERVHGIGSPHDEDQDGGAV